MNKRDFHFDLPPELIAQAPPAERSAGRLLLVPPAPAPFADHQIRDLPELLAPGDLLVFNDTRVIPARLHGRKDSGGRFELLVERVLGSHEARVQLRASKPPKAGSRLLLGDDSVATVLGRDGEFYLLRFEGAPLLELLERRGSMPLPPYITRPADSSDEERYQTLFARERGAVAAPTAGLHFDPPLLQALAARGVDIGTVTLHVGAGTFQPMRAERLEDHHMHSEWLSVGAALCDQVARTRAAGGRIVAVGTTVVRALETAWRDGEVLPYAGETQLFLYPGKTIHAVDLLLTNFHLPESTLLMLVAAFAGRERMFDAYRHAIAQRYRFFSYGDAMLVHPMPATAAEGA